jgi:outer membrane protein OmpA-like peptidoglycan-associated protein
MHALEGGRALGPVERAPAEAELGTDFSGVRVHADGPAAEATERLGARALARGPDIAFAPGEYQPDQPASRALLAHELTHVAQQAEGGGGASALQFDPKKPRAGLGAAPPSEDFIKDTNNWGAEDRHVLFAQDAAEPEAADDVLRQVVDGMTVPQTVHVHGYASSEGVDEYNLNLSAHRAAEIKHRLEKLLPPGSKVFLFAHGESRHFGAAAQNRRAGISVIGPVGGGLQWRPGMAARLHLGASPPGGPYLTPPTFPSGGTGTTEPGKPDGPGFDGTLHHDPHSVIVPPPGLPPGPLPRLRPRHLMDNAALLAPGAMHDLDTGDPVQHWDTAYDKYHNLHWPDELSLGPFDLGAGELANKEVSNAEKAYHERNDPTLIEKSNAETGSHVFMGPNLLDLGKKKKPKK